MKYFVFRQNWNQQNIITIHLNESSWDQTYHSFEWELIMRPNLDFQ